MWAKRQERNREPLEAGRQDEAEPKGSFFLAKNEMNFLSARYLTHRAEFRGYKMMTKNRNKWHQNQ